MTTRRPDLHRGNGTVPDDRDHEVVGRGEVVVLGAGWSAVRRRQKQRQPVVGLLCLFSYPGDDGRLNAGARCVWQPLPDWQG